MKKLLILGTCLLLFPVMASASTSIASLVVGENLSYSSISFDYYGDGNYSWEGGGSIDTSYIDGDELAWLYCVDLFTSVSNKTYPTTLVSDSGEIYGGTYSSVSDVAWLLDNYATSGQGDSAAALQAAIWTTVHGAEYDLDPTSTYFDQYLDMLAALDATTETGTLSDYLWISPETGTDASGMTTYAQGLVGVKVLSSSSSVPEPVAMLLFGAGIAGLAAVGRRRRK